MPAGVLTSLLGKVAVEVGKRSYRKLTAETPVTRAVERTAGALAEFEVREVLASWCDGEVFASLLAALKAGDRNLTDEAVVDSFIQATGFFVGDDEGTSSAALRVVTEFLTNLEQEIYDSPGGISALAGRGEVQHAETLETVQQSTREVKEHVTQKLSDIEKLLQSALSADQGEPHRAPEEQLFHARVDEARDVLKDGEAKVAQMMLRRLRSTQAVESLSTELQFRIANTLGACALRLEDTATAKEEFARALSFKPESPVATGNAAAAALLDGEFRQALELSARARTAAPRDPQASSVYMQALHRLGRPEELKQFVESEGWVADVPGCCLALGLINCEDGDYVAAEAYIRKAIELDATDFHAHMLLANAIFEPVSRELAEDPPLPWRLKEETRRRLTEADEAASRAVSMLEGHDNRAQFHYALTNRAAIRVSLGRWDEALNDCDRVLLEDESHYFALRHKGLILLARDDYGGALRCFERIRDEEHRSGIRYFEAVAHFNLGNSSEAISLLKSVWNPEVGGRFQAIVGEVLAAAYTKLGRGREAEEIMSVLRERWDDQTWAKLAVARRLNSDGRYDEAKRAFLEALMRARTENQREAASVELADMLFDLKEWAEAARYYGGIVTPEADAPRLRAYAASLFNAGRLQEALAFAREVRKDGEAVPVVTEVEASVLEYIDDLEPAVRLREALSRVEPKNPSHLLKIFMLEFRRGREAKARDAITRLRYEEVKDNAQALIHMAEAYTLLVMDGALPLAYRARRLGFDDPRIHAAYMRVFLCREKEDAGLLSPEEVAVDCAVHVSAGGSKEVFVIAGEQPAERQQGEISADDPLAQKLLGHRKGDSVVVRDTGLEKLVYEVTDVQSKYVFAFQETMMKFGTWFPEDETFHRMEVSEDFSLMFKMLDERYARVSHIMNLYRENRLPLGALARLVRRSRRVVWDGLTSSPETKYFAASGHVEDIRRQEAAASGSDKITLDLSALLTLERLGLTDRLLAQFAEVLVPQAVLDEINQELVDMRLSGPKAGNIARDGARYAYQEETAESWQSQIAALERMRDFINSQTKVVPITGALEMGRERFDQLSEAVGEGSLSTMLVAKEHTSLLYADDLGLSHLARNEEGVESVWTQTVLVLARERGVITAEEYHEALLKLMLANYYNAFFTEDDMKWVLRRNTFGLTGEVTRMVGFLQGPECDEDAAVIIASELVRYVWLQSAVEQQRWLFLDFALNALVKGRNGGAVLAKLRRHVRAKFVLLPLDLPRILQSIGLWERQTSGRLRAA
jgi:tetratricopeptide (TPR) repeat protein/predicted nucleic acid-binding protein